MGISLLLAAASTTASTVATAAGAAATASIEATASAVETSALESVVTSVLPGIVASALPSQVTTTAPVTASQVLLPPSFEVAAIFAGALAGGLTAVNRRFDVTGLVTLAIVTGLGGGMIRDVLLQDQGIFALETPRALVAALAGAVVAAFFFGIARKLRPALIAMDAFSLGLFCLVGADKALVAGLLPIAAIMLGTITSVGGGILRDILCDKEPEVLKRGSFYSLAAIIGSTAYVTMVTWLNIEKYVALVVAGVLAVALRFGSLWLGWETPEPRDLSDSVIAVPRSLVRGSGRFLRRRSAPASDISASPDACSQDPSEPAPQKKD